MNTPIPKIESVINYPLEQVKSAINEIINDGNNAGYFLKDKNEMFGTYSIGLAQRSSSTQELVATGNITLSLQSIEGDKTNLIVQTISTSRTENNLIVIQNAQTNFLKALSAKLSGVYSEENKLKNNSGCILIILAGLSIPFYYFLVWIS